MQHPRIIQGGMGVGVSGWRLARAVSSLGQLGVAAGTALDVVLARRLQDGDPGGHVRRALSRFPFPRAAARILDRYFVEGGKARGPAVSRRADALEDESTRAPGAVRRRHLRRGVPRPGRPRRTRRDQLPREDPAPGPSVPLRRDAGRRRLRPDGRRNPAEGAARPRPLREPRARDLPAERDGLAGGRRHTCCASIRAS